MIHHDGVRLLQVERYYCHSPITAESHGFLIQETWEFCTANNPLFLVMFLS